LPPRRDGNVQVRRGINLVYGGGSIGLMGVIARTVRHGGCHVLGYDAAGYRACSSTSLSLYLFFFSAPLLKYSPSI
jgi:hypothetical protein